MKKMYRIDSFINGKHRTAGFRTKEKALEYGKRQNERGEIVFLLKRLTNGTYDVLEIIQ